MYAVVRTGGKQVRVEPGQAVRVEKIEGAVGDRIELDDVLMVAGGDGESRIGTPVLEGVKVVGTITDQGRGKKIIVFKRKRRKGYRKKQGHRQGFTEIRIEEVALA